MDNECSNVSLLGMSEHSLYDLVSSFPEAAHLKDTKTKKYIHSNRNNLKIYGFNDPEKVIGLTVYDLNEFMQSYWGDGFANKITDLDDYVAKKEELVTEKDRIFLDKFGLVHAQNMTKAPFGKCSGKVSAIFTMSFEVTNRMDNFAIFNVYKKIYVKKREACFYFMNHLKINSFFREVLSEKEMMCLLFMIENDTYKYLAKKMDLSIKTIETHINHIGNKTKNRDLDGIVKFLRISSNGRKI